MIGMHRATGKPLGGLDHLRQSIADILSTPIGTRAMRRDYGSLLPELVDAPANGRTALAVFAATAIALARWEPRIRLKKVAIAAGSPAGQFALELEVLRTDQDAAGVPTSLTVPLTLSRATSSPAFA